MHYSTSSARGFIALISAIIISTVLLGLATAIGEGTFFSRFDVLNAEYKRISLGLAEACVNSALAKIGDDFNYTVPGGGITIPLGTAYGTPTDCTITSVTRADTGARRTFTINTRAGFMGAFSNLAVSATAQDPALAPVVPPPTCALIASPTSLPQGQQLTLLWSTAGAPTTLSIDHGVGSVSPLASGSTVFTPAVSPGSVTYTATVGNVGGTNTCAVTATITAAPPAPSCADTVMVLDRTGSMSSSDLSNERAAGNALVTLYAGVASLPKLGAGSFGGLDGSAASLPVSGLLTSTYANITSALTSITASNSSVGSNLGAALIVGTSELGSARHTAGKEKVLILVSDGLPNEPSSVLGNTGTSSPSANSQNASGDLWTSPVNAYMDGAGVATSTAGKRHLYSSFNFGAVPSGSTITGMLASVDAYVTGAVSAAQATLAPASVGIYDQWTANTGSRVAATATNDGDATYIDTSASIATFDFPDATIPTGSVITSVTVSAVARGTSGGASLELVAENGGAPNVGGSNTLTTSYATYVRTLPTNPFTGSAWTLAEVNAWTTRFGVRTTSGSTRVTQVYVTVTYQPGSDSGYRTPTTTHAPNSWDTSTVGNVQTSNNTYASDNDNDDQGYSTFGFTVPGAALVTGIEVVAEAKSSDSSGCQLDVELSSNAFTFTSGNTSQNLTDTDTSLTFGGAGSLWGRTWTPADVNGASFTVRVEGVDPGSSCAGNSLTSLDRLQVRIYYASGSASATLSPTSIGGFDQWTANAGTDTTAVFANDGDTSYIDAGTSIEAFAFANAGLPTGSTVTSVTVRAVARGTGSGVGLELVAENGGAPNLGSTNTLSTGYATYNRVMTTNPLTGSAWTLAEVNAWTTRFGVRTTNSGSARARVTQTALIVDYTSPGASSGCQLGVDLSWNGGGSWTSEKVLTLGQTEATYSLGSASDDWSSSHTWVPSDFTNANFRSRVRAISPGASCAASTVTALDWLRMKIYYSQPANAAQYATDAAQAAQAAGVRVFGIHFGDSSGQNFLASLTSPSTIPTRAIQSITRSGSTVTVTTSVPHTLTQNERIQVSGVSSASFNGTFTITSVPTANTLRYTQSGTSGTSSGGSILPTNLFVAPSSGAMAGIFQTIGMQVCPAAAPSCSNTIDDDGDGLVDVSDPGCHTDDDANNPASYDASGADEWSTPVTPPPPPPPPPPPNISIGSWLEIP